MDPLMNRTISKHTTVQCSDAMGNVLVWCTNNFITLSSKKQQNQFIGVFVDNFLVILFRVLSTSASILGHLDWTFLVWCAFAFVHQSSSISCKLRFASQFIECLWWPGELSFSFSIWIFYSPAISSIDVTENFVCAVSSLFIANRIKIAPNGRNTSETGTPNRNTLAWCIIFWTLYNNEMNYTKKLTPIKETSNLGEKLSHILPTDQPLPQVATWFPLQNTIIF